MDKLTVLALLDVVDKQDSRELEKWKPQEYLCQNGVDGQKGEKKERKDLCKRS